MQKQESGENDLNASAFRDTGTGSMSRKQWRSLFVLWLAAASMLAFAPAEAQTVRTASGTVRGTTEGDVSSFKGIPYAAPPVGDFRWRPPQPVANWEGVRDASASGPHCAQARWGAAPGSLSEGSSEDCLYLDLWKPAGAESGAALPVMVWIHGGGFTGGSGSSPQNYGHQFAKQDVILITINYQ